MEAGESYQGGFWSQSVQQTSELAARVIRISFIRSHQANDLTPN